MIYWRPDYIDSPACHGFVNCDGCKHVCPMFGLPGLCEWPKEIIMDNTTEPYWEPDKTPSLAEKWL